MCRLNPVLLPNDVFSGALEMFELCIKIKLRGDPILLFRLTLNRRRTPACFLTRHLTLRDSARPWRRKSSIRYMEKGQLFAGTKTYSIQFPTHIRWQKWLQLLARFLAESSFVSLIMCGGMREKLHWGPTWHAPPTAEHIISSDIFFFFSRLDLTALLFQSKPFGAPFLPWNRSGEMKFTL